MRTTFFRIVAILMLFYGVSSLIVPDIWTDLNGVPRSVGGWLGILSFGTAMFGLGVLVWLASASDDARTQRAVAAGVFAAFAAAVFANVRVIMENAIAADRAFLGWAYLVFNAVVGLIALYYFMADRGSEASSA